MEINRITEIILKCAFTVHSSLGSGLNETNSTLTDLKGLVPTGLLWFEEHIFSTNISPLRGFNKCQRHKILVEKSKSDSYEIPLGTIYNLTLGNLVCRTKEIGKLINYMILNPEKFGSKQNFATCN